MGWACGTCRGEGVMCIQGFGGGDLREKRPLTRPRRRWEDNGEMGFREIGR